MAESIVKDYLKSKGSPQEAIKKVERANAKLKRESLVKLGINSIAAIVVAISVAIIYLHLSSVEADKMRQTAVQRACGQFTNSSLDVPCESAAATALRESPGLILNASLGTKLAQTFTKGNITFVNASTWTFEIKLDSPYSDAYSKKKIKTEIVSVSTSGLYGIIREPVKTQ